MLTPTQHDLIVVKALWKLSDLSNKTHAYLDYFDNPIAFFRQKNTVRLATTQLQFFENARSKLFQNE